jgi:hypothetical protein
MGLPNDKEKFEHLCGSHCFFGQAMEKSSSTSVLPLWLSVPLWFVFSFTWVSLWPAKLKKRSPAFGCR